MNSECRQAPNEAATKSKICRLEGKDLLFAEEAELFECNHLAIGVPKLMVTGSCQHATRDDQSVNETVVSILSKAT
eukprot:scaffold3851_cov182-Skeletonema_marinoi.AAC.4